MVMVMEMAMVMMVSIVKSTFAPESERHGTNCLGGDDMVRTFAAMVGHDDN